MYWRDPNGYQNKRVHHHANFQKRPDVHKIVLPIKLRFPHPGKSVSFEDFLTICMVFPQIGTFSGWGGGISWNSRLQRPWVYPYPRVSDFSGRNSDHGPGKTQTKTQTTPNPVFTGERRNSDHGLSFREGKTQTMVWISVSQGVGVDPVLMKTFLNIFKIQKTCQSSYPAEVRKWHFSPFFSAKGVVKIGVKFWWNFPRYVFQGLGVRRKISPKFHVKNGVKNGKFHANFTLLGHSAADLPFWKPSVLIPPLFWVLPKSTPTGIKISGYQHV